jgi:uncharacterized protein DUF488
MAKSKKLFTIGYEQTPPKAVLDELERAGVKLLVDVRAVTSSRRPGFSKKQLAAGSTNAASPMSISRVSARPRRDGSPRAAGSTMRWERSTQST